MKRLLRRTLAVGLTALLLVQLIPSDVLAHDFPAGGGNSPYPPDDPDRGEPPPQCQPQQDPDSQKKGDPIDFQKGDFILERQDVRIPGRMTIDVTFTYRSRSTFNGPFGYGWDMSYNRRIRKLADNNVVAVLGNGERETWTYDGSAYTPGDGVFGTLVKNGDGTWSRTSPHALVESYDANGNLTRIQDRNGAWLSFSYDHAGRLPVIGASDYFVTQASGVILRDHRMSQITDSVGRTVDLGYDGNGRLSSLSWAGRTISYNYGTNGDLSTVRLPATPDVPAGAVTTYGYTAHNLTSITDPKGQAYLANSYDEFDCVYQQTYGGFPSSFTYKNSLHCPETRSSGTTGFQLTVKPLMLQPGQPVRVSWAAPTGVSGDTIQFFPAGGGTSVWTAISTSASASGAAAFTVPAGATAGLYEARFVRSGATQRVSNGFRVAPTAPAAETVVTDARGFVSKFQFDAAGHITSFTQLTDGNPVGEPTSYVTTTAYNSWGLPTRIQYPRGNATEFRYDAIGNLTQVRRKVIGAPPGTDLATDLVTAFTYEPTYNLVKTITDPRGNATSLTYDYELGETSRGNVRRVTFPPGGPTAPEVVTTYLATGQIDTVTEPMGGVMKVQYDPVTGLPNRVTQGFGTPDASTIQVAYDTLGNATSVTDPLGNSVTLSYNARNQVAYATAPPPFGWITNVRYDANGNIAQIDRQALSYASSLPALGTTVPGDSWQSTVFTYDMLDRAQTIKDDLGHVTTLTRDPSGNLASATDGNNHQTRWEYDERDLVTKTIDAALGETRFLLDANGNVTEVRDARDNPTAYAYDDFDRVSQVIFANGTDQLYAYDRASNVIQYTDPADRVIGFDYDLLNRLWRKRYPDTTTATFAYDKASRLTSAQNVVSTISVPQYDAIGRPRRLDTTFEGRTWTNTYEYDAAGNRTRLTDPALSQTTYSYDTMNRPTGIQKNGAAVVDYFYDTLSRRSEKRIHGTWLERTQYTYDDASRMTQVWNFLDTSMPGGGPGSGPGGGGTLVGQDEAPSRPQEPSEVIPIEECGESCGGGGGGTTTLDARYTYGYDNTRNRTTQTRYRNGIATSFTYAYDALDELKTTTGGPAHSFDYDATQNRTLADGVSYTRNSLNQYTSVNGVTHTYDANGNLTSDGTRTYGYNVENKLTSVTGPGVNATYTYDALGRRIKKTGAATVVYRYDGPNVVQETDGSGNVQASYVDGPWPDEVVTMTRGGATYGLFYDGTNSVSDVTSTGGALLDHYEYDPYGRPWTTSSVGNPYLFAGREYESDTSLYFNRNRHYSPGLGRFLQRDPLGYATGMNLYSYVGNNPLNWIDPLGLAGTDWGAFWSGFGSGLFWGGISGFTMALLWGTPLGWALGAILLAGSIVPTYEWFTHRHPDGSKLTQSEIDSLNGGMLGGALGGLVGGGVGAWARGPKPAPNFPGNDPAWGPKGTEWRGPVEGSWYNPETGEVFRPDLEHPLPEGPHWDYKDPQGKWWRIKPCGSVEPK
jgi:RHS repeat-associated protein